MSETTKGDAIIVASVVCAVASVSALTAGDPDLIDKFTGDAKRIIVQKTNKDLQQQFDNQAQRINTLKQNESTQIFIGGKTYTVTPAAP